MHGSVITGQGRAQEGGWAQGQAEPPVSVV